MGCSMVYDIAIDLELVTAIQSKSSSLRKQDLRLSQRTYSRGYLVLLSKNNNFKIDRELFVVRIINFETTGFRER